MDLPDPIRPEALLAETGTVRRLARALVRRADLAHDVAQDVMLAALRQRQPPANLRGWLAAVTRRLAGRAARLQRVRERHEGAAAPPPANEAELHTTERLQLHRRLTDAVLALPEPYRTTVTLRFFDELPPRAIAHRLSVSSEVVRKRLQRGLEMLRERLDGDFGDRMQWLRALAAVGLLPLGGPWLLLSVLAMNKLTIAAVATLVVGAFWFWPDAVPPPAPVDVATVAAAEPAAAGVDREVVAADVQTRRTAEPAAPATGARECTIVVVDVRGRPVEDAVVFGWAVGAQKWTQRATDVRGCCSFGEVTGPGGVLVVTDGHTPVHAFLPERRGEHRVALPEGEAIEGTLTVDGQPGVGWRLRLLEVPLDAAVPGPLQLELRWRGSIAVCGRNGAFRFAGLPDGWQGRIELPRALWFVDPDGANDECTVAAPQRQMDLRATQLPTVRGRVVWNDTGEPVAWPSITAYAEFADGQNSPALGGEGYRDGTFAVGFHGSHRARDGEWRDPARRPPFRMARLSIESPDRSAACEVELDADRIATVGELVVRLERAPTTYFRCVDASGAPIAGARVEARTVSEPTETDGRGTFAGTLADLRLVGSPRHRIGPVRPRPGARGNADDPLVFVLEPTNVVRIRIDRIRAAAPRCRLRSDAAMFAGRRASGTLDERLHGADLPGGASGSTQPDGSTVWRDHYVMPTPDAHGVVTLWSLEPGTRCEFQLLDDFDRALVTKRFRAPEFGDELELSVRMPNRVAAFAGRVVDPDGRPLRRVSVQLQATGDDEKHYANLWTDADGRFELSHPGDLSQAQLQLQLDGFVEQRHTGLVAGARQDYTLQRGRELTVHVVDEQGLALDVMPAWRDDRDARRERLREGVFLWRDLPTGVVTFVCRVGGDEFSLQHDTGVPNATLRVPRPGTLHIESPNGWPAVVDARNAVVAVLHCTDGGHQDVRLWRPERSEAQQLLPGAWHVELVEWSRNDRSLPAVERPLGLSADVTLRAGQDTTAILR